MKSKDVVLLEQAYDTVVENKLQALKGFMNRIRPYSIWSKNPKNGDMKIFVVYARNEEGAIIEAKKEISSNSKITRIKEMEDE